MKRNARKSLTTLILLSAIILALSPALQAELAGPQESRQAAENWLNYIVYQNGQWGKSSDPSIIEVQEIKVNDTLLARAYITDPDGFILVPALKDLPAIKASSDENGLDMDAEGGFQNLIKDVLSEQFRKFVDYYGSLEFMPADKDTRIYGPEHRRMWDYFAREESEFMAELNTGKAAKTEELGPLITSIWHQSDPYNQYCPMGDGGRCVVGCVATAASQIMDYHEWPPTGTGNSQYYWSGDGSCGGSTPGIVLTADHNDEYDWENIPDHCGGGCTPEEQAALAELCHEVGVAYQMHYGACGSGAYVTTGLHVFPTYFRYHDVIEQHDRSGTPYYDWSQLIHDEIASSRPIAYRIYSHAIVCDGWRDTQGLPQIHMNYGWGGTKNFWYTVDNLYCPWEGCTPAVEMMLTHIIPDNGVFFEADTVWGLIPLEVNFDGISSLDIVDSWTWNFGDGNSAYVEDPIHIYNTPGRYNITVEIVSQGQTHDYTTTKYVTVLADTLIGTTTMGEPDSLIEVTINACNTVPLRGMKIPVEYGGTLDLQYQGFSTEGCRTDYFQHKDNVTFDPYNKRLYFNLQNVSVDYPSLEEGSGPVLKVIFKIPADADPEQYADIMVDGYSSKTPYFYGPIVSYTPFLTNGTVALSFECGDCNHDGNVNLIDITYLLTYLYDEGPAPIPSPSGDVDANGTLNLLDVTYLINYLYREGPDPICIAK